MGNTRAALLMIFSMAFFAVADAFVKFGSTYMSVAVLLILMSVPSALVFAFLAQRAGQPPISPLLWSRKVVLRNFIEGIAAICVVSALANGELSLVIALLQGVPLFVTIGAALMLKEHVGPRRWIAVAIGFFGVLLMLRPDADGVSVGALFAVGAAMALSSRDLITRTMPQNVGTFQLATWGTAVLILAGLLLMPFTGPHALPSLPGWGFALLASAFNAIGYYAITAAMRSGDVSYVTPFRYTRLVFALILAVLFFNERPDALTLVGAAIVIGSGLFVMWRERNANVNANS
ncbi:DMT family transporter [Planktotalea sp.]|uniref:DMT family transporter n=1 Tax=Planktotalea sp. TaxID=2029877 RepID=UPI0032995DE6